MRLVGIFGGGMETVTCPECPNTATVKEGNDLYDKAYKLSCPVLLDELGRRGGTALEQIPMDFTHSPRA